MARTTRRGVPRWCAMARAAARSAQDADSIRSSRALASPDAVSDAGQPCQPGAEKGDGGGLRHGRSIDNPFQIHRPRRVLEIRAHLRTVAVGEGKAVAVPQESPEWAWPSIGSSRLAASCLYAMLAPLAKEGQRLPGCVFEHSYRLSGV